MSLKEKIGSLIVVSEEKKPIQQSNVMKKAAVTGLLISSLTFNIGFAKENDSSLLQKVYHIYNNGQYIGTIDNTQMVKEVIDEKIKLESPKFKGLKLNAGSGLSFVPEQVFSANTNDRETIKKLKDEISVKADAFALTINNEATVYVKDQQSYDEVIRQLKLQHVSEEDLTAFESRQQSTESLPPLEENETRIVDILFTENVSGISKEVSPQEVLSVDEAVKYLTKGTLEEKKYLVQPGDVLGSIAIDHNMSTKELISINPGMTEDTLLQLGMELNVTVLEPLVQVSVLSEKKETQVVKHGNVVEEDDTMYKGDTKVKQEGKDGKREVTLIVRRENGVQTSQAVKDSTVLVEPVDQVIVKGTKVIPSRGSGSFDWPAQGGYVSSKMGYRWGAYHRGIDIARPSGYNISAADNGIVTFVGWDGTYGNKVVINHQNGYETTYAHLSSVNVSTGEVVPQGTNIGVMGSTGRSTGTHLHFEVRKNGSLINPLNVLR